MYYIFVQAVLALYTIHNPPILYDPHDQVAHFLILNHDILYLKYANFKQINNLELILKQLN